MCLYFMSLSTELEGSPLEKFVLVLKEEYDALEEEVRRMRKDLASIRQLLKLPPRNIFIQGENLCSRFFIRFVTLQQAKTSKLAKSLLDSGVLFKELCLVDRGKFPDLPNSPTRYNIEGYVNCVDYMWLNNIANNLENTLGKDNIKFQQIYIISLERTSDFLCNRYDVLKKQTELNHTQEAKVFIVKDGNIIEQNLIVEIPPVYYRNTGIEYLLVADN